jgi:hypothetical protein
MKLLDLALIGGAAYLIFKGSSDVSGGSFGGSGGGSAIPPPVTPPAPQGVSTPPAPGVTVKSVAWTDPTTGTVYGEYCKNGQGFSGAIPQTTLTGAALFETFLTPTAAPTATAQQVSNRVQQSFGVKSTQTVNKIVIPVTNNQAQNTNNTLRALKGLPPV